MLTGSHWKLRCVFALLFFGMACGIGSAQSKRVCGSAEFHAMARVAGFVFRSYEPLNYDELACMTVSRQGHEVYRLSSRTIHRYDLGQPGDADLKIPRIEDGTDLNGQRHPDMIVTAWSGARGALLHHALCLRACAKAARDRHDRRPRQRSGAL